MFPIKRLEKIHEELHRYYLQVINRKTRLKELDISINSPSLIQYMKERIKNLPLELIYPNNNPEYALSILELMEINTLNQSLRRINPINHNKKSSVKVNMTNVKFFLKRSIKYYIIVCE